MANIYDKSSLVLIPSGTKTGKIFSQKPVSGDGDFTFTRASAATRVNADGNIEKETMNLLTYSNDFSQWSKQNVTIANNAISNPFGSGNTQTMTELVGTTQYRVYSQSVTTTSGTMYNHSVYVKRLTGTRDFALIDVAGGARVYFNMTTIAVGSELVGKGKIEDVGNGWYRLSVYGLATGNTAFYLAMTNGTAGGAETYTSDGSGSFALYAAQVEYGLVARDYIETTTAAVYGGITDNTPRLDYTDSSCPALLLEPLRTNSFTHSESLSIGVNYKSSGTTITMNDAVSPEGYENAAKFTGSANSVFDTYAGYLPSTTNTFSVFAKAGTCDTIAIGHIAIGSIAETIIDLTSGTITSTSGAQYIDSSIVDYGNGWYRASITYTSGTTAYITRFQLRETGYAYTYGWQIEHNASYPTSYIPTYGSSVTRNFDYSIVESLGYSSTCTFYYEFNTTTGRETSSPFVEIGKDQSNKIWIKGASANGPQFSVQGNGIFSGSVSLTNEVSGINKIAVQCSSGVGVVFSNGVKQSGTLTNSNTSENIDFISTKGQGTSHDSKQLLFFPTALTDQELIDLTTI